MIRRPLTESMQRILAAMPDDWIDQDELYQCLSDASGVGTTPAAMERRGVIDRCGPQKRGFVGGGTWRKRSLGGGAS